MRRSFKLHLFIRMFLAAMLIVFVNRQISQNFLRDQTEQMMHAEMAQDLSVCQSKLMDTTDFIRCAQGIEKNKIYNSLKDAYLTCPIRRNGNHDLPICAQASASDVVWQTNISGKFPDVEFSEIRQQDEAWLAMRSANTTVTGVLLLNQFSISSFVDQLWQIRDSNLAKSIPALVISVLLLALYIVFIMLRPLRLIEGQMSQLNSQNLFSKDTISSPFKEFNRILDVYHDLRKRLADSFSKARRFSSDVAHELRTPLSILRGNAERIITELPTGSPTQVQVRLMSDEIERLILITEKLLLLSRADANSLQLELKQLNLSELLTELIKDARSFHRNLNIKHKIQANVMWLCDPQLVHQLVQNLYTNAVKYNKPDGWIDIQLSSANGQLRLTLENPTQEVSQDLTTRGFERFYRGDASRTRGVDGFGLGLSICQEIAQVHQGSLTLSITSDNSVQLTLTAPLNCA